MTAYFRLQFGQFGLSALQLGGCGCMTGKKSSLAFGLALRRMQIDLPAFERRRLLSYGGLSLGDIAECKFWIQTNQ